MLAGLPTAYRVATETGKHRTKLIKIDPEPEFLGHESAPDHRRKHLSKPDLGYRLDASDPRDSGLEVSFDPGLQCHCARGAAHTGAMQTNLDFAFVGHVNQFEISAIGLDGWPDHAQDLLDLLAERGVVSSLDRTSMMGWSRLGRHEFAGADSKPASFSSTAWSIVGDWTIAGQPCRFESTIA